MDAIKIMADEKTVISYRPKFNKHTGSVFATILLQQAAYWWCKMGEQPYYKFKEPCNAPQYRDGESWCEELGFSRREFDTACTMLEERGFIHKKTDMSRLTWYTVSQEKISEMMDLVYGSRKGGNALYVKAENAVTYRRKTPFDYTGEYTGDYYSRNRCRKACREKTTNTKISHAYQLWLIRCSQSMGGRTRAHQPRSSP